MGIREGGDIEAGVFSFLLLVFRGVVVSFTAVLLG